MDARRRADRRDEQRARGAWTSYWLHRAERLSAGGAPRGLRTRLRRGVRRALGGARGGARAVRRRRAAIAPPTCARSSTRAVDESILLAAPPLIAHLREALEILDDPEIRNAYGARDVWQLVDTLARMELGRDFDVVRARTMAAAGTLIIGWLAEEVDAVPEEVADAAAVWLSAFGSSDR